MTLCITVFPEGHDRHGADGKRGPKLLPEEECTVSEVEDCVQVTKGTVHQ